MISVATRKSSTYCSTSFKKRPLFASGRMMYLSKVKLRFALDSWILSKDQRTLQGIRKINYKILS